MEGEEQDEMSDVLTIDLVLAAKEELKRGDELPPCPVVLRRSEAKALGVEQGTPGVFILASDRMPPLPVRKKSKSSK